MAMALDSSGNVYVSGDSGTVAYSPDGTELWVGRYGGRAIAIDHAGSVYVSGQEREVWSRGAWRQLGTKTRFHEPSDINTRFADIVVARYDQLR